MNACPRRSRRACRNCQTSAFEGTLIADLDRNLGHHGSLGNRQPDVCLPGAVRTIEVRGRPSSHRDLSNDLRIHSMRANHERRARVIAAASSLPLHRCLPRDGSYGVRGSMWSSLRRASRRGPSGLPSATASSRREERAERSLGRARCQTCRARRRREPAALTRAPRSRGCRESPRGWRTRERRRSAP